MPIIVFFFSYKKEEARESTHLKDTIPSRVQFVCQIKSCLAGILLSFAFSTLNLLSFREKNEIVSSVDTVAKSLSL